MNYIKQLNAFWERQQTHRLKTSSIALYVFLLCKNNEYSWKPKFTVDYEKAVNGFNISKNTYYACMDELRSKGYITFEKSFNRNLCGNISIIRLYVDSQNLGNDVGNDVGNEQEQSLETDLETTGTLVKPLNLETSKPFKPKKDIDPPSIEKFQEIARKAFEENKWPFTPAFGKEFLKLIQEKKWRTKSQTAINTALKELTKYDIEFALILVNKAIAGNWQGITFTNTDSDYKKWKDSKNGNNLKRNGAGQFSFNERYQDRIQLDIAAKNLIADRINNGYEEL